MRIHHIVGLQITDTYLAMMWETTLASAPRRHLFHFNYMERNYSWGLNKAAVLHRSELRQIMALYGSATGKSPPC